MLTNIEVVRQIAFIHAIVMVIGVDRDLKVALINQRAIVYSLCTNHTHKEIQIARRW